jgi:hypothetical protein
MGYMGKIAFCVIGMLVLFAGGSGASAEAKELRASGKRTSSEKKKTLKTKQKLSRSGMGHQKVNPPELGIDASLLEGLSQFGTKFVSHRVRFAASEAPVPEEYDCDPATAEVKRLEAEQEALSKCERSGEKHCRLHRSVIAKNGELKCADVPGRSCRRKEYFRGCVARALAIGGEAPTAAASAF